VLDEHAIALPANVEAIEPLGYLEMLAFVADADVVLTDSGGLQKEAYWLRVPCVTVRPNTEWVGTVEAGANVLVEPEELAHAVAGARFPADPPVLYGDGHASDRIAAALYS
jgi:UDP-N-acetylglucosamine 2-epimerase